MDMSRLGLGSSMILAIALSPWSQRPSANDVADREGSFIDGVVTYQNLTPVKGATVSAEPLGRAMGAITPHAETDQSGYFVMHISRSWFGKFAVAAMKEDEDYPDMVKQFYSDGKFVTVTLTPRHPHATVTLRLGPRAGVLVGTVADAVSQVPLSPCVEFRRAAEPGNFMSASGLVKPRYKLLIPPDAEILMKISLDGYKTWYYPGTVDKTAAKSVRLAPGENKSVDIRLEPDAKLKTGCPAPLNSR
jgi:hypothetical protein